MDNEKHNFLNSAENHQLIILLKGCKKEDRVCQRKLYEYFFGYALSICIRYSSSYDDAVEILNEGFMKVFLKIDKYDFSKSFKGWLRRIMINTSIDHYRKNIKHKHLLDIERANELASEDCIASKISYDEIIELVQKLPTAYRTVFCLYVIDGYKHKEISRKLGISIGASKSNLSRARKKLKELLINIHGHGLQRMVR
jgi:RNA polymerase sigma factor (sigma-70 family)